MKHHKRIFSCNASVIVVSDTRTPATDKSGAYIKSALSKQPGVRKISHHIVNDSIRNIRAVVRKVCKTESPNIIILTGGTGMTGRDVTPEAIIPILDKRLDGFGEIFRMISFKEVGTSAWFSRTFAGTISSTIVFGLPGSLNAVKTALKELIIPELPHIASMLHW